MNARRLQVGIWFTLSLMIFANIAPAQGNSSVALNVLAQLVSHAEKNNTFAESPTLCAAYLAAGIALNRPPTRQDIEIVLKQTMQDAIQLGVGEAEKQEPATAQQNGAGANSVGTTTLAEKPGIADLINLAIERGAITQNTTGTSFTLQTTPYMIYSQFGANDTEATWNKLTVLRQIGISATFNQTEGSEAPTSNNFESGEIKYVIGNRSPRDKKFIEKINYLDFSPTYTGGSVRAFISSLPRTPTPKSIQEQFLTAAANLDKWVKQQHAQQIPITTDSILSELSDSLQSLPPLPDQGPLMDLMTTLEQEGSFLATASKRIADEAQAYLQEPHPQFSLAYTFNRDLVTSDFSDLRLIYGYQTDGRLSANLDGDIMINNHRLDVAGNQLDRVRAYAFSGGLTLGKFAHDALDFTAAANWMRPTGDSQDIRSFQAKLNLYLAQGVTIPFSLTYTNSTIDPNSTQSAGRSRVRLNVGLSLSGDALMGAARQTMKQGS